MDRNKIIVKTSVEGIVVNIILVVFKAIVGFISSSIAIVLDAVNNLTDALSSTITIVGTKLASKAPDKDHPYGHGRIEYFTSVIIAGIVLFAGITALKESVEKVIDPGDTNYTSATIIIITVAVLVKFFFGKYVKNVGKRVNSQSLVASGEDARMDAFLSLTTLIGAIISVVWGLNIEGYLGILIALFIIKAAVDMLKESANSLLGIRADKELSSNLKKRIVSFKEVQGAYDLNLHNYGPSNTIGSVHIQVRNDMTAEELHILSREIAYKIYEEFGITLTVGVYAANDKGEFGNIKKELFKIVKKYKEILQVHGFYVDKEKSNVFFDIIIDFETKNKEEIKDKIVEELSKKFPKYNYNVILYSDLTD